jgi:branched-subunit amino acid aminotransferase/4-amino-4-deoxychorismate lyase
MPFLDRHAERLARSVRALGLPDPGPLAAAIPPLAGTGERVIRIEVGAHGIAVTTRDVASAEPMGIITFAEPYKRYPHKTTERAQFTAALAAARSAGAGDALLVTADGVVAEGTTWSLFWWEGDRLATPALDLGVLPGVARERLGALLPLLECHAPRQGISGKPLFAANAARGVVPVARLDGVTIPQDPRTAELARAFWPA